MSRETTNRSRHKGTAQIHFSNGYFHPEYTPAVTVGHVITALDTQGRMGWAAGGGGGGGPDLWGYFSDTGTLNNTMAPAHNPTDPNGTGSIGDSNWVAPYPNLSTEAVNVKMMMYDYSKSAFRAGRVSGNRWQDANRGQDSIGLGFDTLAAALGSVSIGSNLVCDCPYGATVGGTGNNANGAASDNSGIFCGNLNLIQGDACAYSIIGGGQSNQILDFSSWCAILGGQNNVFNNFATQCGALGGSDNVMSGNCLSSIFIGSIDSIIHDTDTSAIIASQPTTIPVPPFAVGNPTITGGNTKACLIAASQNTYIENCIQCALIACSGAYPTGAGSAGNCLLGTNSYGCVIEACATSFITESKFSTIASSIDSHINIAENSAIIACRTAAIAPNSVNCLISAAYECTIDEFCTYCTILGGYQNIIAGDNDTTVNSTIVNGQFCFITNATFSTILGGLDVNIGVAAEPDVRMALAYGEQIYIRDSAQNAIALGNNITIASLAGNAPTNNVCLGSWLKIGNADGTINTVNLCTGTSANLFEIDTNDGINLAAGEGGLTVQTNTTTHFYELIGTNIPAATSVLAAQRESSAIVQIDALEKGFLPPRMTEAQRTAIALPAVGLVVYQTNAAEGLYVNKSTGWALLLT